MRPTLYNSADYNDDYVDDIMIFTRILVNFFVSAAIMVMVRNDI